MGRAAYCATCPAGRLAANPAELDGDCRSHHVRTKYVTYADVQNWQRTKTGAVIFKIAGFDSQKVLWISGLNNIFYAFATFICVFTLDRIGRRWTLWWGAAGQAIAMFLAGGLVRGGLNDPTNQEQWGIGATAMIYLYTFVFGATWLTVPWLYPAEIFPLKVRAKGSAWGGVGWSLGNG